MNTAPVKCPFVLGQVVRATVGGPEMRIVAIFRGVNFLGMVQPDRFVVEWTTGGLRMQANLAQEDLVAVEEPAPEERVPSLCFRSGEDMDALWGAPFIDGSMTL